jgi:hypothetical protein
MKMLMFPQLTNLLQELLQVVPGDDKSVNETGGVVPVAVK